MHGLPRDVLLQPDQLQTGLVHEAEGGRRGRARQVAAWRGWGVWQVRAGTPLPHGAAPLHADGLQVHPAAVAPRTYMHDGV